MLVEELGYFVGWLVGFVCDLIVLLVWFIKMIGDVVMLVCFDLVLLLDIVLKLVEVVDIDNNFFWL